MTLVPEQGHVYRCANGRLALCTRRFQFKTMDKPYIECAVEGVPILVTYNPDGTAIFQNNADCNLVEEIQLRNAGLADPLKFEFMICIECGIEFAAPALLIRTQHETGGFHSCPNGHRQGWNKDECELARMRRERDRLKQNAARLEQEIVDANARAVAAEKRALNTKRRAVAALCPCCNRSFANVARHMKSKHPNVTPLALQLREAVTVEIDEETGVAFVRDPRTGMAP